MTDIAINRDALSDHLANIVDGTTMREIGRKNGVPASTVMRRLNKIENLRGHADWDAVISAAESHYENNHTAAERDRDFIAAALGTSVPRVHADLAPLARLALLKGSVIMMGDLPKAALSARRRPPLPLDRASALAALAFGWIEPSGTTTGPARTFAATEKLTECLTPPSHTRDFLPERQNRRYRYSTEAPIDALFRRRGQTIITAEHVKLAQEFHEVYALRNTLAANSFKRISGAMPPRMITLLNEVCGKHTGFEAAEKAMDLPARSAKALISFSLDCFAIAKAQ